MKYNVGFDVSNVHAFWANCVYHILNFAQNAMRDAFFPPKYVHQLNVYKYSKLSTLNGMQYLKWTKVKFHFSLHFAYGENKMVLRIRVRNQHKRVLTQIRAQCCLHRTKFD